MTRFIEKVELIAGLLLGAIALLTFCAVMARWLFNYGIPDAFDFSRLLLGTAMFWGIALAGFHNRHIQVDGLWEICPSWARRGMDIFATLVTLGFFALFAWMLHSKVLSVYASNEQTFDLRLPVWPFHAVAALGIALAALLLLLRLIRLIVGQRD
ncbi:MAG TPA: TRAP transporter small permease [Ferrovibrio sp.]|uniref:TRAP transporter small permease n=1 Tax=Ferrovibrio sp. TaxID=1917215 RepID=UPI002B4B5217|nr:TRAP transporter small permease [Ferrovibrio sp.]HLT79074.1 TRAP transporter small permease [Ferrovibrio sp.]